MKDKPLKAQDIAKIAGISGSDMKRIAENYEQVIPSRILGRVRLYEQKAAGIVEKIHSMEASGTDPAEIIRELGGKVIKKSTREKIEDKVRKERLSGEKSKKQPAPVPSPQAPTPSRGREEKAAFLELKLDKLTSRVERLEKELDAEKKDREKEREEFRKIIRELSKKTEITGEWVDYFDRALGEFSVQQDEFNTCTKEWIEYTEEEIDCLKMPFWKRKR